MANKRIFSTGGASTKVAPVADTVNAAGGVAYKRSDRAALAQIACTNCFNGTFYTKAEDTLTMAKAAAQALKDDPEFIAKVALYARRKGYMKDMPAFLCVVLSELDKPLFRKVFPKVIDNGKMLRNAVQMARSGAVTGHRANMSAGMWRRAIKAWFDARKPDALFQASIGNDPTMKDILKMARPKPETKVKEAVYAYFLGKDVPISKLPEPIKSYEKFKKAGKDKRGEVPVVDFRLLDSLGLTDDEWKQIALRAPWTMTRMNLNTFKRHNVFKDKHAVKVVADRLRDPDLIRKARVFPYQLFMAWQAIESDMPHEIKDALQDAMEVAIDNVPTLPGDGFVCVDCSYSMQDPVTGKREDDTSSKMKCNDVAALIASAVVRKNRSAKAYTFDTSAKLVDLNPRDTVLTNANKLQKAGGGTAISVPLRDLNRMNAKGDWVLYVSDNESWVDSNGCRRCSGNTGGATELLAEWQVFKKRNPKARLILIDINASSNSQAKERPDILQVGGWSDQVFEVMASFAEHGSDRDHWIKLIENISLDG